MATEIIPIVNPQDPAPVEPDPELNQLEPASTPGGNHITLPDPVGGHLVVDNQASGHISANSSQALTSTSSEFTLENKHLDYNNKTPSNNLDTLQYTIVNTNNNTVANNNGESDHENTSSNQNGVININSSDSEINASCDTVTESSSRKNLLTLQENEKSACENSLEECSTTDNTLHCQVEDEKKLSADGTNNDKYDDSSS